MVIGQFIRWCETASVEARRRGVEILARAYVEGGSTPSDRVETEEAFLDFLADPSDRVRRAMAEILAPAPDLPAAVVLGLCEDIDAIAVAVAGRSPCLKERDLCHLAATRPPSVQAAIAGRPALPARVVRQIAETGAPEAASALLGNRALDLVSDDLAILARRFCEDGALRAALLERPQLPAASRHALMHAHAQALSKSGLVQAILGARRGTGVVEAAVERAEATIARDAASQGASASFVEHLRVEGRLTEAFLFRALMDGNVDFFAAALGALSGYSDRRVRSVLVEGRERPLASLLAAAGLGTASVPVVRSALRSWKSVAEGSMVSGRGGARSSVLAQALDAAAAVPDRPSIRELVALLGRMAAEATREEASLRTLRAA